jgi:cephalosporin hydroxylase
MIDKIRSICNKYQSQTSVYDLNYIYDALKTKPSSGKKIVNQLSTIIEIGVNTGASLKLWSTLLDERGLLIGIDAHNSMLWNTAETKCKTVFIQGDSRHHEVLNYTKYVLNGSPPSTRHVDFLFIDGGHDYETVKSDFEMYSPLVRKGGLIAFHDYCSSPEIREFVDEIPKEVTGKLYNIFKDPDGNLGNMAYFYRSTNQEK